MTDMPRYIEIPAIKVDTLTKDTVLRQHIVRQTAILGYDPELLQESEDGESIVVARLLLDGRLAIWPEYRFDLGSGGAIDDPAMQYASVAHDVLYDMMREGLLPWDVRPLADAGLRGDLLLVNRGRFHYPGKILENWRWMLRRGWSHVRHAAVRVGYPVLKHVRLMGSPSA